MPAAPYLPPTDAAFDSWLLNFSTLLTAAPATYGLAAPDAIIVAASYSAWHPAYVLSVDPMTRTRPVVAQKDAERASAEATVRPFARSISLNAAVDPLDKIAIGVNLPNTTPVPIPPPLTFPQLALDSASPMMQTLRYQDSGMGSGKRKPYGAIGLELWRAIGTVPAVDPAQCDYYESFTKAPLTVDFTAPDQGKIVTYYARWTTKSGPGGRAQKGPWSGALSAVVM